MKILYYQCKNCGTKIDPDTRGVFVSCRCGSIALDGDGFRVRFKTNCREHLTTVTENIDYIFRIRQKSTGLFFSPGRTWDSFTVNGRYYTKKPSLKWVRPEYGSCEIVKYIANVIN